MTLFRHSKLPPSTDADKKCRARIVIALIQNPTEAVSYAHVSHSNAAILKKRTELNCSFKRHVQKKKKKDENFEPAKSFVHYFVAGQSAIYDQGVVCKGCASQVGLSSVHACFMAKRS